MTTILVVIGLFFVIYLDATFLKKQNRALYEETVSLSAKQWLFLFVLLSVVILPVYLFRRNKFINKHKKERATVLESSDTSLYRLTDATGIIITWACIVFIIILIIEGISLFKPIFETRLDEMVASSILYLGVMVYLIYSVTKELPYQGFLNSVGFRRNKKSFLKIVVAPMAIASVISLVVSFILMTRRITPSTPLSETLENANSPTGLLYFLVMALLVAPLFEEWIFRGYFFSVIKQFKGTFFAVCFISLIFAILHVGQYWGDWLAIFVVALLGVSLTLVRLWSGSTISSVIMHYTYNILITVIPIGILLFSNPYFSLYATFYNQLSTHTKEELLLESIKKYPRSMEAYNDLAWLYATEGRNLDEALNLVDKALATYPDSAAYLDTKAEILYKMGYFEEAITIEEKIVEENPTDYFKMQLEKFKEALKSQKYL